MSGAAGARRSLRTKLPGDKPNQKGQPPVARAALFGLCPRCGAQTLFDGPVKFAPHCRVCTLDYSAFNVGDGPAAFLTLIIGALLIVAALTLDAVARPLFWVHILLWVPLTAAAVVYGLRVGKAALLAIEHQRQAAQGRTLDDPDD